MPRQGVEGSVRDDVLCRVKFAEVRSPGDDKNKLVPVAGLGCLQDTLCTSLHIGWAANTSVSPSRCRWQDPRQRTNKYNLRPGSLQGLPTEGAVRLRPA